MRLWSTKTVWFFGCVVSSWNKMHSRPEQLWQQHMVILEGRYQRGWGSMCCEASAIRWGVTECSRSWEGTRAPCREIVHKWLTDWHRLNKNRRANKKPETKRKDDGWNLEAGQDCIAENWCWCSRQMWARADTAFKEKKDSRRETCQGSTELMKKLAWQWWICTELAMDKNGLFSFPKGRILTPYAHKFSGKLIRIFWVKRRSQCPLAQSETALGICRKTCEINGI